MWELDHKESWAPKNWCSWTVMLEKTLESPLDWRWYNQSILMEINSEYSLEGLMLKLKRQHLGLLMWEQTYWKRPWCWEGLGAGGKGDDRGWDGSMASLTQLTWVCASSRRWGRTGKPQVLQSMGLQRVGHAWGWTTYRKPTCATFCNDKHHVRDSLGRASCLTDLKESRFARYNLGSLLWKRM